MFGNTPVSWFYKLTDADVEYRSFLQLDEALASEVSLGQALSSYSHRGWLEHIPVINDPFTGYSQKRVCPTPSSGRKGAVQSAMISKNPMKALAMLMQFCKLSIGIRARFDSESNRAIAPARKKNRREGFKDGCSSQMRISFGRICLPLPSKCRSNLILPISMT